MAEETHKRRDSLRDQMSAEAFTEVPQPPYIFTATNLIFLSFSVDPRRVQPLLPPGLTLADGAAGVIVLRDSGAFGWGLTHQSGGFAGLVVNEHRSPDTSEAVLVLSEFNRGPALTLLNRHYQPTEPGRYEVRHEGDITTGVLYDGADRIVVEVQIRRRGTPAHSAGIDRYLALRDGTLVAWDNTTTGESQPADLLSLRITEHAPPAWQALAPVSLNWALLIPEILINKAAPVPAGPLAPATRGALLTLMERQGRACVLLTGEGAVLQSNARARALLGPAAAALSRLGARGSLSGPVLLDRPDAPPLIVQTLPLDPVLAGPDAMLCLIDDPTEPRPVPGGELLHLLGLTPAEARVAAAVGAGLPPREAALRLGLTESTVRSALKVIFDKLGVKRQAELVRLVARLDLT